jgi:HPt (histidine-containing phosphotransfer) domain-containing protein
MVDRHSPVINNESKTITKMSKETPDLSYLLNLAGDNQDFVKEILKMSLQEIPADAANLQRQSDTADWLATSRTAHKLKSSAANLGLSDLKDLLYKIEKFGKENNQTSEIPALVAEVMERLQTVYPSLEDYIAR